MIAIEEALDLKNFKLEELMGKLLSHEDKMNQGLRGKSTKKKGLALTMGDEKKCEPESLGISNEELTLIAKRLGEYGTWTPKNKTDKVCLLQM